LKEEKKKSSCYKKSKKVLPFEERKEKQTTCRAKKKTKSIMVDLIACFKDDSCFHNLTEAQKEEANHAFALKQDYDLNIFFQVSLGILIFFMQAGFALLEAGSVRVKNTTNILLKVCLLPNLLPNLFPLFPLFFSHDLFPSNHIFLQTQNFLDFCFGGATYFFIGKSSHPFPGDLEEEENSKEEKNKGSRNNQGTNNPHPQ